MISVLERRIFGINTENRKMDFLFFAIFRKKAPEQHLKIRLFR